MACLFALGTAPAAERPDAWPALVIDDVVRIASRITRCAFRRSKAGQLEPGADFDQHVLKRPDIAVGGDDRLTDRIGRPFDAADRAIEERNAIPAFEIGRVRKNKVGIADHLGVISI